MKIILTEKEMREAISTYFSEKKFVNIPPESLTFDCEWDQQYDTMPHDFEVSAEV